MENTSTNDGGHQQWEAYLVFGNVQADTNNYARPTKY